MVRDDCNLDFAMNQSCELSKVLFSRLVPVRDGLKGPFHSESQRVQKVWGRNKNKIAGCIREGNGITQE